MPIAAPIVDQKLASLFAGEPDPVEALAEDQSLAMIWKTGISVEAMVKHGRLVLLTCGHFAVTKSLHRSKCRRCGEMIRAGYDYDAFRNLGSGDAFSWPDDPLRLLHEKSDR
jgi:hypothetical protein